MDTLTRLSPAEQVCSVVVQGTPPRQLSGFLCALRTHPAECIHHNSPCVTLGKVLENSEMRALVEIWNPFQPYTGRKLGVEQQSPQF